MTPILKEQIEQWIEREALNHECSTACSASSHIQHGAHSILPMLLCAVEALEEYSDLHHAPKLEEALNKIKSMMEGNVNE